MSATSIMLDANGIPLWEVNTGEVVRCPNSFANAALTDENSYSNGVLHIPW